MKILFTIFSLTHSGAERVVSILANEMAKSGHEVTVLLYYDRPVWYELDKRVRVVSDEQFIGKTNAVKHVLFRNRYFRKNDFDVILSFLAPMNMVNLVAAMGTKKKIIVADRNDPRFIPKKRLIRAARNFLYRFADGVVAQSKENRGYFSKCVQKKCEVIFNPIQMEGYRERALSVQKRDEIVSVGRLIEQKNPMMLLEAFARFVKMHPSYSLIFYGEGECKEKLEQRACALGIEKNVVFPGAVKNIFESEIYAKLFVMTSQFEGMPNALIEAMCIGVPVISTKVSGAVDLIQDGMNGKLIECNDIEGLYAVMTEMIDDYETGRRYAENAVQINNDLTVERIANQWMEMIRKVIE